jgi:predicted Zn finger-like uncharacterized protein
MKVVCDACQAKYQIPDERVEGRKLKIRCRKCGGTIVVRGDGADANGRASLPPSAPPEWHVSVDGEQHGPYPSEQMANMLREGVLAWDAHVWRERYAEWKAAAESDTLVRAVAAISDDAPTFAAPAPTDPASNDDAPTFSAPAPTGPVAASYAGDETPTRIAPPQADDLQPSARNSFAARSAQRASTPSSPNLRAVSQPPNLRPLSQPPLLSESRPPRARYSTPPQVLAAQQPFAYADPRVAADAALTGERHEDSVLFSTRQSVAPMVESVARPGYATVEGSGLIDIRALAALAQTQRSSAPAPLAPSNGKSGHHQDDVLRMANQTGAFARLDSLAPLDRVSVPPSRALPIAIISGCAMIAMAGVAIVYLLRVQPAAQPVAVSALAVVPAAVPPAVAPTAAAEAPSAAPQPEPPQPNRPAVAEVEPEQQPEPAAMRWQKTRPEARPTKASLAAAPMTSRGRAAVPAKAAKTAAPKQEPVLTGADKGKAKKEASPSIDDLLDDNPKKAAPEKAAPVAAKAEPEGPDPLAGIEAAAKSKEKPKTRSIDELLDDAVPVKEKKPGSGAAEASSVSLPETPSRDQVKAAMLEVQGEVQACAEGQSLEASSASVAMTISGASGHVSSAQVSGIGGTVGSCIARAVRGASFPKFAKAQFSITFPFKLKK